MYQKTTHWLRWAICGPFPSQPRDTPGHRRADNEPTEEQVCEKFPKRNPNRQHAPPKSFEKRLSKTATKMCPKNHNFLTPQTCENEALVWARAPFSLFQRAQNKFKNRLQKAPKTLPSCQKVNVAMVKTSKEQSATASDPLCPVSSPCPFPLVRYLHYVLYDCIIRLSLIHI